MKCADCQYHKDTGAMEQLNGAPPWFCTKKHTETEGDPAQQIICLLRMVIWELAAMQDLDDDVDNS